MTQVVVDVGIEAVLQVRRHTKSNPMFYKTSALKPEYTINSKSGGS